VDVHVLGRIEVVDDRGNLDIGGPRVRMLLAALVLQAGTALPAATIADAVWGDTPPASAHKTLQTHVFHLRRALGPSVIRSTLDGYGLVCERDMVDANRFENLLVKGRRALDEDDAERGVELLDRALMLWRGPPYPELADWRIARAEAARLEELRLLAQDERATAMLRGDPHALVAELEVLVRAEPLRERRWVLLALALCRAARQGDALRALSRARNALRDELGISPGRTLRELELAILRQESVLESDRSWRLVDRHGMTSATGYV
jgi:DNA-binding SARP family transcriptional activator